MTELQPHGQIMDFHPQEQRRINLYRRNGKLQSCNPCRRSKLACGHELPVCGRCRKRKRNGDCIYEKSPLTQKRSPIEANLPTPSTSAIETPPNIAQSVEGPQFEARVSYNSELLARVPRAASAPLLDHRQDCRVRGNPGFLGSTSYSSIFTESLGNLGVVAVDLEEAQARSFLVPGDRIIRGCQILAIFKDRFMINHFVDRYFDLTGGCGVIVIEPIMRRWLDLMWRDHGPVLKEQRPEKIRRLSELLWRNTPNRLIFDGTTTAQQWIAMGSGHNIRWETIGLIAVSVGLAAQTMMESDSIFKEHHVSRQFLAKKMSETAEACLSFCREADNLDDMLVWLIMENYPLTSALKGEGSYAAYDQSGQLNCAVVAKGLHQEIRADERTPFWLAELRKRTFIQTYGSDVSLATFLGRPPRLSYRYCSFELPLDLTDTEVLSEGDQLQKAVSKLDKDGWNTTGKITRTTWMRTWLGFAPRREDLLDLSLGSYSKEEVLRRAEEITELTEKAWLRLPKFLQEVRHQPSLPRLSPLDALYRNVIRQGFLANELLLQRVLVRKTGADTGKLIEIARSIFADIIVISTRHDIAKDFQIDLTYLLAAHGLRSAAIIAVELLKQEQLPYSENPRLPRSETVQNLSVFAARLGSVDPTDGTFAICDQGRRVITRILDKILAPPRPIPVDEGLRTDPVMGFDTFGNEGDIGFGVGAPLSLENDNDFMQWLENVDWERGGAWPTL